MFGNILYGNVFANRKISLLERVTLKGFIRPGC